MCPLLIFLSYLFVIKVVSLSYPVPVICYNTKLLVQGYKIKLSEYPLYVPKFYIKPKVYIFANIELISIT
ncbi:hypothetical protein B4W76_08585 [Staphylococcus intermedius]|nr:hypothetical protein B4W76_08585 [Staphylococcus intermedius]